MNVGILHHVLDQMYESFADLDTFKCFPDELEDVIFDFAYGMTRKDLHTIVAGARTASFRMPVPRAWRLLINGQNDFNWRRFLHNPQTILIDTEAVKETLDLMNWNAIRAKTSAISHYIRTTTKKSIRVMLDNPITCMNPQTASTAIHMVWHILTCCEPQDFRVDSHRNNKYNRYCFVPYFNRPLSAYMLPNKRWTGWDEIAHQHHTY